MARENRGKKSSSVAKKLLTVVLVILLVVAGNFGGGKLLESAEGNPEVLLEFFIEKLESYFGGFETIGSGDYEEVEVVVTSEPKEDKKLTEEEFGEEKLEIYFFDVGQADSILLLTGDKAMLVDTGNAGDATTKNKLEDKINLTYELNRLGVERIDFLVATHAHEDHMGSMYKIVQAFEIGDLYINSPREEDLKLKYFQRFMEAINEKTVHLVSPTTLNEKELMERVEEYNATLGKEEEKIVYNASDYIRVGDTFDFGSAKVTMLAPSSSEYSDTNDYSIVFMVEFEGVKVLLTGDAGKESEEEMLMLAKEKGIDLNCDVLKVGHHGSRTANTEAFIEAVDAEYAIIMVGEKEEYDLPDEEPIARLERCGATIYQTINEGDIKLTIDDGEYDFDLTFTHHEKGDSI